VNPVYPKVAWWPGYVKPLIGTCADTQSPDGEHAGAAVEWRWAATGMGTRDGAGTARGSVSATRWAAAAAEAPSG